MRTPRVRSDADGEEQLHDHPHGPAPRGLEVRYYAWCRWTPSQRALRYDRTEAKLARFHGDADGSPKILKDLREDGETISRKTDAKVMRDLGLEGVCPRRWKTTTVIDVADAHLVDALQRRWDAGTLNQIRFGDISFVSTWAG